MYYYLKNKLILLISYLLLNPKFYNDFYNKNHVYKITKYKIHLKYVDIFDLVKRMIKIKK